MIYVDDLCAPFRKNMRMSHLMAIPHDKDALVMFAASIGLKPEWYQDHPRHPHFDVCQSKRICAIDKGAIQIGAVELVKLNMDYLERKQVKEEK